jgi:hypothetical protein
LRAAAALLALSFASVACQRQLAPKPAGRAPLVIRRCDYRLEPTASGKVKVQASCQANGPIGFRVNGEQLLASLHSDSLAAGGRFRAPDKSLAYEVDLADLASRGSSFDSAERVGASFVAPLSSVLVVPEPLTTDIPVTLHVVSTPPLAVAVGLTRDALPGVYHLMAHEIPVATYFAFGKLQQRTLEIGGAKLEIAALDEPLDQSFDQLASWIGTSASAVRDFYGVFPVPRASVTVIPVPQRNAVVYGKVLPESSPGIALLVGEHASHRALYSDWILVHELFHLGFPSFFDEGKWLDEGLATYYEPIIRVRAGLYTESEMWDELEHSMPQGLPAYTDFGLEQADDFRGIYWGGAIACLVADVEARKRSAERGLEVGLRALREAGGNACEVWSLADAIATVDHALGAPTLAPVAAQHAKHGSAFDLRGLFQELGVSRSRSGRIVLSDAAPLAAVRRAITGKP